jgi:EipB-like
MNRPLLTRTISALALTVFAIGHSAWAAGPVVNLAPHRAYYDLEAGRLDGNAGISAISGKLAFEISGSACNGYAVSYRVANRYTQGEGSAPQITDNQQTSFESGDGLELDMQQKNFVNAKLLTQSRIKVKKPKAGEAGEGEIIAAETTSIKTDAKAVFPTEYQRLLSAAALAGESRFEALVFEGSDGDKPMRAIAFIGPRKESGALANETQATLQNADALNQMPFWRVSVSYYSANGRGDDAPLYQATFNMLENGVSTDLLLDYGTYALKGKLSKIEMLKKETCD